MSTFGFPYFCSLTDDATGLRVAVDHATALLQGVDDVQGRDGLAGGVLAVGGSVADSGADEALDDATDFLVEEAGDALDATTASKTTDRALRDALEIVTEKLLHALGGASLRAARLGTLGHSCRE